MIELKSLEKRYIRGGFLKKKIESRGVNNLNLTIEPGAFGLLGVNGAGKTTTLKMIATLLRPTSGQVLIDGKDSVKHERELRKTINMITGSDRMLYFRLTGLENLLYFASLYGMSRKVALKRSLELLEITGLTYAKDKRVEEYSRGMKQRLTIARGLINDPKILLLDEPTLGLDVSIAKEIRTFIKEVLLNDPNRTVILTSHYMNEIEDICSKLGILQNGELIYNGDFSGLYNQLDLRERHKFTIPLSAAHHKDHITEFVGDGGVWSESDENLELLLPSEEGFNFLKELHRFPIKGLTYTQEKPALEEAILKLSEVIV